MDDGEPPPRSICPLWVYPNPAGAWVSVSGSGERVEVYDVLGRLVRVRWAPLHTTVRLDVGDLPGGTYVIRRGKGTATVTVR